MRTLETTVYTFDELDEPAKETAREWWRRGNMQDSDWHEYVIEDCKAVASILGISIDDIYFSVFYSQGDGACFSGYYSYEKGSARKIREYAPTDKDLHSIADCLADIQRRSFYSLEATVKHRGHYCHSGFTDIDTSDQNAYGWNGAALHDETVEVLRSFMDWIYRQLETAWEFENSDDTVDECLRCNVYEFTESGEPV